MPLKKDDLNQRIESKINKAGLKKSGKDTNKMIGIRFNGRDKTILEDHFKEKGIISISVGIRQIIYDYMKDKNLI